MAPPRTPLTLDEGMMLWRARDAYRAQGCLWTLVYGVLGLQAVGYLLEGRWAQGGAIVGMQALVLWGLCWVLRRGRQALWWGIDRARSQLHTWWYGLLLVLVLSGLCTGCQDITRAVAKMYGYPGDPYASPCLPQSLQAGYCVTAQQGTQPQGGKP
jgi:hypothetical protein